VLAVAAVDEAGRPYRKGTRGDYVDVAAPGVNVLSAAPGGALQPWTGTSFAVPFAAAALSRAMLATGNDPAASLALVRSLALDLGPAGIDPVFGAGLLRMPADCG
jgi:subtilisin family serine protease